VLLDLLAAHVVKMTIVKVVNVTLMVHRSVAATRAVTVCMVLMFFRGSHCFSCSRFGKTEAALAIKLDAQILFLEAVGGRCRERPGPGTARRAYTADVASLAALLKTFVPTISAYVYRWCNGPRPRLGILAVIPQTDGV
jgi:hypothetical protein